MQKIKATRMELLNLRKQLKTAKRGHKLLKEKRDGLMKKFMDIVAQVKKQRKEMEQGLSNAFGNFALSTTSFSQAELEEFFSLPTAKIKLKAEKENIMSVWIPKFKFDIEGKSKIWSSFSAPLGMEQSIKKFRQALKVMIALAEKEHALRLLSKEIETTRRRVNALEHLIVPRIQSSIKYISSKLDEQERAEKIIRLKVKEMLG